MLLIDGGDEGAYRNRYALTKLPIKIESTCHRQSKYINSQYNATQFDVTDCTDREQSDETNMPICRPHKERWKNETAMKRQVLKVSRTSCFEDFNKELLVAFCNYDTTATEFHGRFFFGCWKKGHQNLGNFLMMIPLFILWSAFFHASSDYTATGFCEHMFGWRYLPVN